MKLIRKIKKLLYRRNKVIGTPSALSITNNKQLKDECFRLKILLISVKPHKKGEEYSQTECPIEDSIIEKIAIYPICAESNKHWIDLTEDERQELLRVWIPKIKDIARDYDKLITSAKPKTAFIFQGYLPEDAVLRHLAIQHELKIITIERTLRNDRLMWESTSGITVNKSHSHLYYWKYQDQTSRQDATHSVQSYLAKIKSLKQQDEHASPKRTYTWNNQSKKILFLGQVYTDASLLYGLDGFKNPIQLIGALLEWVEKNNHSLVIKLHPKEHTGSNPVTSTPYANITEKLLHEYYSNDLNRLGERVVIDFSNAYDTYDLIEQSDLVATINSQAGLEAAIMGKAVVHGRRCFYGGLGFTYEFQDHLDLSLRLDQALAEGPRNIEEAQKFFHIFCEKYCIKNSSNEVTKLLKYRQ